MVHSLKQFVRGLDENKGTLILQVDILAVFRSKVLLGMYRSGINYVHFET